METRTKLKKSLKNILNDCKIQIVFKNKTRFGSNFHFKDRTSKDPTSGVICGLCYYGKCVRHLNWKIGEHIGISPKHNLSLRTVLFCSHSTSYEDFSILTCENKNVLLELKESLLIMRDKPYLNRNITFTPFNVFNRR